MPLSGLSVYTTIPFILMLLSIAILPLVNARWWHCNFPWVSLFLGLPVTIVIAVFNWPWLYHTALEYISFIALLGSLYIISGGILLKDTLRVSSLTNTILLIIGAVVANIIGTTGASMLLIRPMIRLNKKRKHKAHLIVFFIFIVGNIAGSLTPLGDPPLFLGFLKGVPFFWTLKLFPVWLFTNGLLLLIFFITDHLLLIHERFRNTGKENPSIKIFGKRNIIFLCGVITAVLIYSRLPENMNSLLKNFIQVGIMGFMAWLSLKMTPKRYRNENGFTWAPIKEVAILFAAIFATMIPALKILESRGAEMGIQSPHQFFWATGSLSSFLDNAPTYLSFISLGKSVTANMLTNIPATPVISFFDGTYIAESILFAISMGAVFMGAMTYIGNGPNFMIKSVSEEAGIKMPSFFGYMLWSILILIPIFILNTVIFF
ncbi:MAG: sodium:proton antiporter [Proteobacteria bacterium]|nr:sodium:proton antiporter [Pseudomonadota bacterium]